MAIETLKNGMPRFAFTEPSIGSTTTIVFPSPTRPTSSETIVTSMSAKCARIAFSAAWSIAVVSSPPSPWPRTDSRAARDGMPTRTPRTSSVAARQTASQSVKRIQEQAARQLRIEERALLRQHLAAAGDLPDVLDARRAEQERSLRIAAVDGCDRLAQVGRVGDAFGMERVHDDRVGALAADQLVPAVAVEHDAGQLVAGRFDRLAARAVDRLREPVRGEDREPLLPGGNDDGEEPRIVAERERRLVAVMTVRDEQLRIA